MREVAVVGIGETPARKVTPEVSYRELIYQAAMHAYEDAGIDHTDVDGFISSAEDFLEGTSIFDEYVPDQIGGAMKPVYTVSADGIYSIISGVMQIRSGISDIVLIEAHSKASEIMTYKDILGLAYDPLYIAPLKFDPYFLAGLEAQRYLFKHGIDRDALASVVYMNKSNAILNPLAAYSERVPLQSLLTAPETYSPLTDMDISKHADYACVMILAAEEVANKLTDCPVWVRGVGFCSGSPNVDVRKLGVSDAAGMAGQMAYATAGISPDELDIAEVDDMFSYRELIHIEALGLSDCPWAGLSSGEFLAGGRVPLNTSGGALGFGHVLEASGLVKAAEIVKQLRCEAGQRQVDAELGLAHAWRGLPTESHGVVIMEVD
jgi:acetyl-CoA C-acetyltransferase